MYYKVSPIIIVLLTAIVIGIIGFGTMFLMKKTNIVTPPKQEEVSEIIPVLNLSVSSEEENQESVTITAVATTEDPDGIYSITLPDGTIEHSDNASYTVYNNGNYKFKVKGVNGKNSSLTLEIANIRQASASSPYMPTGFSYLGGDIDTGYVIQDNYKNEYVWIPVPDGKLTRNTLLDNNYEEVSSTVSALVNSVAQNYGFYIGRFEATSYEKDGQTVAASIGNRNPWVNISYLSASEYAAKSASFFGYEGYQTAIINSYAWDTAIAWINQTTENYSTSTNYGNYSGSIRNTGMTESDVIRNVCDLSGNVREWTTEIYKNNSQKTNTSSKNSKNSKVEEISSETVNYRVVRGGSANLSRTASSHTGYKENSSDPYWGFRMILYK